jgi:hypothetical protein
MGPLITREHRDRVASYLDGGGGAVVVDGRAHEVPGDGFFLGASLVDHVEPGMPVYDEEVFGPVLSVVRVPTYDDAVRLVNDNPYGNGTAIFTRDGGAARQYQHEVVCGMVGVNVAIPVPVAYYSFGGWKASLFGDTSVYGPSGVDFYTRTKVVTSRWPGPVHVGRRPRLPPDPLTGDGLRRRAADEPAGVAGGRPGQAGREPRLQPRLDLRLPPAVGGAVRHLQPDPVQHPPGGWSARW